MTPPDITDPKILTAYLQSNDDRMVNSAVHNLADAFKHDFTIAGMAICKRWPSAKNKEAYIVDMAFWDGLTAFYEKIKQDGFEDRGIPVKEVFKAFVVMQLRGQLIKNYRESLRKSGKDPDVVFSNLKEEITICYEPGQEHGEYAQKEKILKKAYDTLKANCRNIIEWRKLLKIKKEVVAVRLGIQPDSVTNELHKCIKRLKHAVAN